MAEEPKPNPPRAPSPEEVPWGISYLREDIQDLRQDLRHEIGNVHRRIDETREVLSRQIGETNGRIDEFRDVLARRIDSRFALLLTTMVALTAVIVAAIKL